jgi:DnaJ-class molecular chaperone
MICGVCKGPGHLLEMRDSKPLWWTCPACGGDGVTILYGPPTIKIHLNKKKVNKKSKQKQ